MDAHRQQIEALVVMFMEGYPSLINATEGNVAAYVRPLLTLSPEAVRKAIDRFTMGEVPGQRIGHPPNATELYIEAQKHHAILSSQAKRVTREVPEGYRLTADGTHLIIPAGKPVPPGWDRVPMGTTVDHGHGMIHIGGLTRREAQVVDDMGGVSPDGKNFARMTLPEMRAEIARYLPAPVAA